MINEIVLFGHTKREQQAEVAAVLEPTFGGLGLRTGDERAPPTRIEAAPGAVVVPVAVWCAPDLDPVELDRALACGGPDVRSLGLSLSPWLPPGALARTTREVLTRCQRLLPGRNREASLPLFDEVLALHQSLHDLSKPLVAADHAHALDTWRWVVRLGPTAGLAVQIAALFHDVERLVSEADVRIEQHAADYLAFKQAHAETGAEMVRAALARVGAPAALVERVAALVATHERPDDDPDRLLLNEADALSFFSLNACGFIGYYGRPHTVKKVRYTLDRLGPRGRAQLASIRHRADIAAIMAEVEGAG